MNRVEALLIALLTVTSGAELAWGDETPKAKDLVATVQEARKLSDVYYYYELGAACNRHFILDRNGSVSVIPYAGRVRLVNDEGHVLNLPDKAARVRGAELYRGVLKDLRGDRRKNNKIPAPLDLLHIGYVVGAAPDAGYDADRRAVREGYLANPSSLIALVYLEVALIEKEFGQPARYRELIHQAVAELELARMTYQADVRFRVHLREDLNFARPEACLLFLAAEDARLGKRAPEAIRGYTTMIERAPGSPFAWEALAKLSVMPKVGPKKITRLSGILLETYPLLWGCPRPDLKIKKEEFATQLPALLKKVGQEEAGKR